MPAIAHKKTNQLLKVATVPATIVMGGIVGLCTFPCSGGIYVSIITLLNAKTTLAWGLGYLALYNVLFVAPLVGILLAAGNRTTAKAWARWERVVFAVAEFHGAPRSVGGSTLKVSMASRRNRPHT